MKKRVSTVGWNRTRRLRVVFGYEPTGVEVLAALGALTPFVIAIVMGDAVIGLGAVVLAVAVVRLILRRDWRWALLVSTIGFGMAAVAVLADLAG
jgi:hypothetical protein